MDCSIIILLVLRWWWILSLFTSSSNLNFTYNSCFCDILYYLIFYIYCINSDYLSDVFILLLAASSSFCSLFNLAFIRICWCSIILRAYFADVMFFCGLISPYSLTMHETPFQRAVRLSLENYVEDGIAEFEVFLNLFLSFSNGEFTLWSIL